MPLCSQAVRWRASSSITQSPIASISPISSASGMNSPGGTMPPLGSRHRISASTPATVPSARSTTGCQWSTQCCCSTARRRRVVSESRSIASFARRSRTRRSRPARLFDWYIAVSAFFSSVVGVGRVLREQADPDRGATRRTPRRRGRTAPASASWTRVGDRLGHEHRRVVPGDGPIPRSRSASSSRNSSPPCRATRSVSRVHPRSRSASCSQQRSPAWWPSESFTSLKLSRSRKSTPTPRSCRRARAIAISSISSKSARFGRPVSLSWYARNATCSSARLRSVMSKITPWISQGSPARRRSVGLLEDPLDRAVLVDHPVLVVRGARARCTRPGTRPRRGRCPRGARGAATRRGR